jgi:uncharacterized protein YndB with AHSA1/START domain
MSNYENAVTVQVTVDAPIALVWEKFTHAADITQWYFATPTWHAPSASNDLQVGGRFRIRMEEKNGEMGFDFEGTYLQVNPKQSFEYILADDRKVLVSFTTDGTQTTVSEKFDTENENSAELQRQGWQAILDNFKNYVENLPK